MKIALAYGPFCSQGRAPYDIPNLYRAYGLTGSESSFFNAARGLAELGHEVVAFCECEGDHDIDGAAVLPSSVMSAEGLAEIAPDAMLAWNEPDMLRWAPRGCLRVVAQQLNDWSYCAPGFVEHMDVIVFPTMNSLEHHEREHMAEARARGVVIPNSINLEHFADTGIKRDPHRVVWCSSPDRGLHHLLSMWPDIKARVPEANLHIFYRVNSWLDALRDTTFPTVLPNARRARYVAEALRRLSGERWGVTLHDSVPNIQMAQELQRSAVLAYPCDPIRYTEGFGVSVLDACAAGCIPIISDADALPEAHGKAAMVIKGTPSDARMEWISEIVDLLIDKRRHDGTIAAMRAHAEAHHRIEVAKRWESMLEEKLAIKRAA